MRLHRIIRALAAGFIPLSSSFAGGLGGSPASMSDQHEVAVASDYTFVSTSKAVDRLVDLGALVPAPGNADYALSNVSFPFARPEVLKFIEQIAADYREAFGFKLVVTSLTRPADLQPSNSHTLSVHPAGMAVDLRIPADSRRREWLEAALLKLEDEDALDVTRERNPPHYHVAVFRDAYLPIGARLDSLRSEREAFRAAAEQARADSIHDAQSVPSPAKQGFPGLLFGTLALVGITPVVRRVRRARAERRATPRVTP